MTKPLTPPEVKQVQETLSLARAGSATLGQLAEGLRLAEQGRLNAVVGELREHVRRVTPAPVGHTEIKSIMLGILAGIITQLLMKARDK